MSNLTDLMTQLSNCKTSLVTNLTNLGITASATESLTSLVSKVAYTPATVTYPVGTRISDDSSNPVGTVSSIFTDGNNQSYAVVCLDAQYRLENGNYLSNTVAVAGIPQYSTQLIWSAPETATTNTTAILAQATTSGLTSTACTNCRAHSFTIGGVTYEGQLPNINELTQIFAKRTLINAQDPTASTYSSLIIPTGTNTFSSTQHDTSTACTVSYNGLTAFVSKINNYFVIPVLEIPL